VKGDEGRMAAEGHCNVGLALEESGKLLGWVDELILHKKICKSKFSIEVNINYYVIHYMSEKLIRTIFYILNCFFNVFLHFSMFF
jgi:hypothetical protein